MYMQLTIVHVIVNIVHVHAVNYSTCITTVHVIVNYIVHVHVVTIVHV